MQIFTIHEAYYSVINNQIFMLSGKYYCMLYLAMK